MNNHNTQLTALLSMELLKNGANGYSIQWKNSIDGCSITNSVFDVATNVKLMYLGLLPTNFYGKLLTFENINVNARTKVGTYVAKYDNRGRLYHCKDGQIFLVHGYDYRVGARVEEDDFVTTDYVDRELIVGLISTQLVSTDPLQYRDIQDFSNDLSPADFRELAGVSDTFEAVKVAERRGFAIKREFKPFGTWKAVMNVDETTEMHFTPSEKTVSIELWKKKNADADADADAIIFDDAASIQKSVRGIFNALVEIRRIVMQSTTFTHDGNGKTEFLVVDRSISKIECPYCVASKPRSPAFVIKNTDLVSRTLVHVENEHSQYIIDNFAVGTNVFSKATIFEAIGKYIAIADTSNKLNFSFFANMVIYVMQLCSNARKETRRDNLLVDYCRRLITSVGTLKKMEECRVTTFYESLMLNFAKRSATPEHREQFDELVKAINKYATVACGDLEQIRIFDPTATSLMSGYEMVDLILSKNIAKIYESKPEPELFVKMISGPKFYEGMTRVLISPIIMARKISIMKFFLQKKNYSIPLFFGLDDQLTEILKSPADEVFSGEELADIQTFFGLGSSMSNGAQMRNIFKSAELIAIEEVVKQMRFKSYPIMSYSVSRFANNWGSSNKGKFALRKTAREQFYSSANDVEIRLLCALNDFTKSTKYDGMAEFAEDTSILSGNVAFDDILPPDPVVPHPFQQKHLNTLLQKMLSDKVRIQNDIANGTSKKLESRVTDNTLTNYVDALGIPRAQDTTFADEKNAFRKHLIELANDYLMLKNGQAQGHSMENYDDARRRFDAVVSERFDNATNDKSDIALIEEARKISKHYRDKKTKAPKTFNTTEDAIRFDISEKYMEELRQYSLFLIFEEWEINQEQRERLELKIDEWWGIEYKKRQRERNAKNAGSQLDNYSNHAVFSETPQNRLLNLLYDQLTKSGKIDGIMRALFYRLTGNQNVPGLNYANYSTETIEEPRKRKMFLLSIVTCRKNIKNVGQLSTQEALELQQRVESDESWKTLYEQILVANSDDSRPNLSPSGSANSLASPNVRRIAPITTATATATSVIPGSPHSPANSSLGESLIAGFIEEQQSSETRSATASSVQAASEQLLPDVDQLMRAEEIYRSLTSNKLSMETQEVSREAKVINLDYMRAVAGTGKTTLCTMGGALVRAFKNNVLNGTSGEDIKNRMHFEIVFVCDQSLVRFATFESLKNQSEHIKVRSLELNEKGQYEILKNYEDIQLRKALVNDGYGTENRAAYNEKLAGVRNYENGPQAGKQSNTLELRDSESDMIIMSSSLLLPYLLYKRPTAEGTLEHIGNKDAYVYIDEACCRVGDLEIYDGLANSRGNIEAVTDTFKKTASVLALTNPSSMFVLIGATVPPVQDMKNIIEKHQVGIEIKDDTHDQGKIHVGSQFYDMAGNERHMWEYCSRDNFDALFCENDESIIDMPSSKPVTKNVVVGEETFAEEDAMISLAQNTTVVGSVGKRRLVGLQDSITKRMIGPKSAIFLRNKVLELIASGEPEYARLVGLKGYVEYDIGTYTGDAIANYVCGLLYFLYMYKNEYVRDAPELEATCGQMYRILRRKNLQLPFDAPWPKTIFRRPDQEYVISAIPAVSNFLEPFGIRSEWSLPNSREFGVFERIMKQHMSFVKTRKVSMVFDTNPYDIAAAMIARIKNPRSNPSESSKAVINSIRRDVNAQIEDYERAAGRTVVQVRDVVHAPKRVTTGETTDGRDGGTHKVEAGPQLEAENTSRSVPIPVNTLTGNKIVVSSWPSGFSEEDKIFAMYGILCISHKDSMQKPVSDVNIRARYALVQNQNKYSDIRITTVIVDGIGAYGINVDSAISAIFTQRYGINFSSSTFKQSCCRVGRKGLSDEALIYVDDLTLVRTMEESLRKTDNVFLGNIYRATKDLEKDPEANNPLDLRRKIVHFISEKLRSYGHPEADCNYVDFVVGAAQNHQFDDFSIANTMVRKDRAHLVKIIAKATKCYACARDQRNLNKCAEFMKLQVPIGEYGSLENFSEKLIRNIGHQFSQEFAAKAH